MMYIDIISTLTFGVLVGMLYRSIKYPLRIPPIEITLPTPVETFNPIPLGPTPGMENKVRIQETQSGHLVHITTRGSQEHLDFLQHPETYKITSFYEEQV
jgi:hypothetical protein